MIEIILDYNDFSIKIENEEYSMDLLEYRFSELIQSIIFNIKNSDKPIYLYYISSKSKDKKLIKKWI